MALDAVFLSLLLFPGIFILPNCVSLYWKVLRQILLLDKSPTVKSVAALHCI